MKAALLLMLLAITVAASSRASGPTTIDITTTDAGVTYKLDDYDARAKKDNVTPQAIEEWIRKYHPHRPDEMVIIRPDSRATFKIVSEMLRRLKSAGVKTYSVNTYEDSTRHAVIGHTGKLWSEKSSATPAPK